MVIVYCIAFGVEIEWMGGKTTCVKNSIVPYFPPKSTQRFYVIGWTKKGVLAIIKKGIDCHKHDASAEPWKFKGRSIPTCLRDD